MTKIPTGKEILAKIDELSKKIKLEGMVDEIDKNMSPPWCELFRSRKLNRRFLEWYEERIK
jgi:hypothetical protein